MRKTGVGRLTLGLVLAVLGVSLLMDLNFGYSSLETVASYWPVVLILLGLEYVLIARDPEKNARLSPGPVLALIIILCLTAAYLGVPGFIRFSYIGWSYPGQQEYTVELPVSEQFDDTMDQLDVEAVYDVFVTGTGGDRVDGTARVTVRARTADEARRIAEQLEVVGRKSGSTLFLEISRPDRLSKWVAIQPAFELSMPSRGSLEAKTISGDTDISGITGKVDVDSVSGEVFLDDKPSSVRANLISGDLHLTLNPEMKSVHAKTVSGDVTINVPSGTGGSLDFSSVSGDLDFAGARGGQGSSSGVTTTRTPGRLKASGQFGTGRTDIEVDTVSGDLVIR